MYLTTLHCHALASSRMPAACCMSCNSSYHISRRSIVVCVVFSLKKANICSISCNCSTKLATLWVNGHSLVPLAASGHIWSRVGHMLDLAVSTLPTAHSPWANTAKSETYELTVSNHTQFLEVWNIPLIINRRLLWTVEKVKKTCIDSCCVPSRGCSLTTWLKVFWNLYLIAGLKSYPTGAGFWEQQYPKHIKIIIKSHGENNDPCCLVKYRSRVHFKLQKCEVDNISTCK